MYVFVCAACCVRAQVKASAARAAQQASSPFGGRTAGSTGALSTNFSCRISPWLAAGCLSPREMYRQMHGAVLGQQPQHGAVPAQQPQHGDAAAAAGGGAGQAGLPHGNAAGGASWLVFELLWRDFFSFVTKKYSAQQLKASPAAQQGRQRGSAPPAVVAHDAAAAPGRLGAYAAAMG